MELPFRGRSPLIPWLIEMAIGGRLARAHDIQDIDNRVLRGTVQLAGCRRATHCNA